MASNQGRSDLEHGSSPPRASGSHPNENTPRQRPLSLSAWEVLGAVSAFKYNVDRMRFYKSSISTIKFLSILNITYTVVGVVFLFLSMFPTTDMNFNHYQKQHFFRLGVFISIFSPVALITDLLALKGLRQWRRGLMIPWLILYGILIALAFAVAITELYHRGIRWPLLLLAFCSLLVFSRWRHLSLQYKLMGIYPEKPSDRNIDQLADDIRVVTELELRTEGYPNSRTMRDCTDGLPTARELPPKYEDLDQPPKYDEQMFLTPSQAARAQESNPVPSENELPTYQEVTPAESQINEQPNHDARSMRI